MKNILLVLLVFAASSYAIDSLKINNTYVDSAVLTASELNEDNDSCEVWSERLVDTLNIGFTRWSDFNSGDSSLSRLNVDTIGGSPYIEGSLTLDGTLTGERVDVDTIGDASGNANVLLSSTKFDVVSDTLNCNELVATGGNVQNLEADTLSDNAGNVNLLLSTDNYTSPLKKFGFGKTSLESWDAGFVGVQVGGNDAIVSKATEGVSSTFHFANNCYYDGAWKRITDDEVGLLIILNGLFDWYLDAADTEDLAFTPTKRMSLSTTKLDVDVDTVDVQGIIIADSIYTASGWIDQNGTFACSLFDNTTYRAHVTARYTINGNIASVYISTMTGTMSGGVNTYLRSIPAALRPNGTTNVPLTAYDNGNNIVGALILPPSNSQWQIVTAAFGTLTAGTGGITNTTITYLLDTN